jgi:hypothetical protein
MCYKYLMQYLEKKILHMLEAQKETIMGEGVERGW